MKDPEYVPFFQKCKSNPYLGRCAICKADFSSANRGTYLINRHLEHASHKRLAEVEANQKCIVFYSGVVCKVMI
jgi:hypothetical protein